MSDQEKWVPNWISHANSYQEALEYMVGRKEGTIHSFKTPWVKINDAGINGFEWNSIIIIAGRPGGGKTLMKDQIIREGFKLNKGQKIRALEFQMEMVARNSKIREFSSVSRRSYKYLCSAETEGVVIDDDIVEKCRQYAVNAAQYPIDIVDKRLTIPEWKQTIINYMEYWKTKLGGTFPLVAITADHSVLFKKVKGQSTLDMLNELGEVATELKKIYPVFFIILSQLGRDIESSGRCENGKHGNYPTSNDIFGGDALNQHADMVIILDRPATRYITRYGPHKFIINSDKILAAHIVKTRTGDTRMSFFAANFHNMRIDPAQTPPQQKDIKEKKEKEPGDKQAQDLANTLLEDDVEGTQIKTSDITTGHGD